MVFRFFVAIALFTTSALAYPGGAPPAPLVCSSLHPQHGPLKGQTSPNPYVISVSESKINAGDTVEITLRGNSNNLIKGFLFQGRVGSTPVGQFQVTDSDKYVQKLDCSGKGDTVTHKKLAGDGAESIKFTWKAPANLKETVVFTGTIVKNGATFWEAQTADKKVNVL